MRTWRRQVLSYTVAVLSPLLAAAVKLALQPLITREVPFLLSAIAVMAAAWVGGFIPGLIATFLSALLNEYFFIRPFNSMALLGSEQVLQLAVFTIEGIAISLLCAKLLAARQRAEASEREARNLERQILEISDAEQRRIGHDLHDGLGQHLTGISLMAGRLSNHLQRQQPQLGEQAGKICELAKTAVEWTHDLSRSLSPPSLERDGLLEALSELASNVESVFNVQCTIESESVGPHCCPTSAAVHLYRIAQEAISNAIKHAQARQIRLQLTKIGSLLSLTIIDDGAADAPHLDHRDHEGMGLRIMQYRANMIGASFSVGSAGPRGTSVSCEYNVAETGES